MGPCVSQLRYRKINALDALSEICVFVFPVMHYLCTGLGWNLLWDVVSLVTLGVGMLNIVVKQKLKLHGYEVWLVFFFVCCVPPTILSRNINPGIASLVNQAKIIIYCVVFMFLVIQKKNRIERCFLYLFLGSIGVAVITISNADIDALLTVEMKYLSGLRVGLSEKENVNISAFNMTVGFIASALYMNTNIQKNDKAMRIWVRIGQLVILTGVFFTGSRKSLLSCALVIAFEFFDIKKLKKITSGLFLVMTALYLVMEVPLLYRLVGARIESFFMGNLDASDMTRSNLAEEAKEVFLEHPIIGVGIDQFKFYSSHAIYAHNNMLEILADFGILGFIVYYSIFIVIFYKLKLTEFDYRQRTVVVGAVVAYFSMEFTQVSYLLLTAALFLSLFCVYLDFHARSRCRYTIRRARINL